MKLTTDKLYKYAKSNSLPLLGNSNFDFWLPYVSNHSVFDRFFRDKYLSWFYWVDFPENSTTDDIYDDFVEAIDSHLSINAKRYSELYRVQVLAANAYDIVNNYDLTETHTNTHSETGNSTEGAREDSTSTTTVDGARSDSGSTTVGAATNTSEKEMAGFNSSAYSDADKQTDTFGTHTDTTSVSKGSQTNTNNSTLNKGAQSNSHSISGSENINIRRFGNIGVQTAAEIIGGHIELWDSFNFYNKIFEEIAKEYLLINEDYNFGTSGGGGSASDEQVLTAIAELSAKVTAGFAAGAKSSQINGLATTSQLNDGVENICENIADVRSEVTDIDTTVNSIALNVSALQGSSLVYKNEIIGSIEGVSTDEY